MLSAWWFLPMQFPQWRSFCVHIALDFKTCDKNLNSAKLACKMNFIFMYCKFVLGIDFDYVAY